MMRHLQRKHGIKVPEKEDKKPSTTVCTPSNTTLDLFVIPKHKYSKGHIRKSLLDTKLMWYIIKDVQPLSIVESEWFQSFTEALDPKYELPSRRTVTSTLLPNLYKTVREKVSSEVKNSFSKVSLTTDSWTSRNTENYVTVWQHIL